MIVVSGENVADLLPAEAGLLRAALGGGPANTAVAAAVLGARVSFAARFGSDAFGQAFRARLSAAGVDLSHAADLDAPSALALTSIDASGAAEYDFWLAGAADFAATALPDVGPHDIRHVGSLGAYWPPGADVAERWAERGSGLVTLDVNLRPIVLEHQPDAVPRLERLVQRADVVKASDEDLRMAHPDAAPEDTARRWLAGGSRGRRHHRSRRRGDGRVADAARRDGSRPGVRAPRGGAALRRRRRGARVHEGRCLRSVGAGGRGLSRGRVNAAM